MRESCGSGAQGRQPAHHPGATRRTCSRDSQEPHHTHRKNNETIPACVLFIRCLSRCRIRMHIRHQTLFSPLPHVYRCASVAHLPSCVTLGKIWQFSYLYGTQKGETMTTTSEAVELFLASLRPRSAPAHTIKSYSHDLRHFVQAVPADLASVSAPAIQIFLDGDGHHSPATRGRRYSTLCALYMYVIHTASFVERVPEAGSCSSVGERAVAALGSPPALQSHFINSAVKGERRQKSLGFLS